MSKSVFRRNLWLSLSAALLLCATALAGDTAAAAGRGSFQLDYPVTVAGTPLKTGEYRAEWTGSGDQVEVTIYQGKKAVATTHGRVSKVNGSQNTTSYATGENGTRSLTEVFFSKQKIALTFAGEEQSAKK